MLFTRHSCFFSSKILLEISSHYVTGLEKKKNRAAKAQKGTFLTQCLIWNFVCSKGSASGRPIASTLVLQDTCLIAPEKTAAKWWASMSVNTLFAFAWHVKWLALTKKTYHDYQISLRPRWEKMCVYPEWIVHVEWAENWLCMSLMELGSLLYLTEMDKWESPQVSSTAIMIRLPLDKIWDLDILRTTHHLSNQWCI